MWVNKSRPDNISDYFPLQENSHNPFSDELTRIFQWLLFTVLCQVVCVFGVGSNTINIICFIKQGFKDPVNISLMGLAMADIGCIVTIMWTNLCLSPAFIEVELPFEPMEIQFLTGAIPHTVFTRISSWITALITLERCLCIIAPIKVRTIVTSKRVTIVIACVFLVFMATTAPIYLINGLGMKFYPDRNKTLIGMILLRERETIEMVSYLINNVSLPATAFIVTITCTTVLVIQLHNKAKWRKASSVSVQADNVSMRNQKVSKMVVMISVLFISCLVPVCILYVGMSLVPELSISGKYRNAMFIFGAFGVLLESVNSSANIFIYYHMSSKYKQTLRQLFGIATKS